MRSFISGFCLSLELHLFWVFPSISFFRVLLNFIQFFYHSKPEYAEDCRPDGNDTVNTDGEIELISLGQNIFNSYENDTVKVGSSTS